MRLNFTIILLSALFVQMASASSAQNVSISRNDASLVQILKDVKKQTGYDFIYPADLLQIENLVTINAVKTPLKQFLDQCFGGQSFSYSIVNKTIVVVEKPKSVQTKEEILIKQINVHGTVSDEQNQPLPGATVKLVGGHEITVTDGTGSFVLNNVPGNDYLIISFIGFKTDSIAIGNRTEINVTLHTTHSVMKEVVVSTGYQTLSLERSAGSFAKPDMAVVDDRSTSMNILQRIDGQIPGFTVNNAPLSQNPYLIRGLSTIGIQGNNLLYGGTSRNPLYAVDGVPIDDVSSINPQDVADVTVLKDATAASIWGARAANGVIVITTKKGGRNESVKVSYDGFINFLGKPNLDYVPVLNSQQYVATLKQIFDPVANPYNVAQTNGSSVTEFSVGIDPVQQTLYNEYNGTISASQANSTLNSLALLNNHQQIKDLFYRNAYLVNQTISLSGGGKVQSFYGSLAYTDNVSPRPGEKDNTYKVNLHQDFRFNDRIQLFLITDLTNELTHANREPAIDYRFVPYQMFQDSKGNNLDVNWMGYFTDAELAKYQNLSGIDLTYNPLNDVNTGYTDGNNWLTRITSGATIKIFKGLRYEGTYGYLKAADNSTSFDDQDSYRVRSQLLAFTVAGAPGSTPKYYLPTTGGNYDVANTSEQNWTLRNTLVYDNNWKNGLHQLTLLAGQEAQDQLSTVNNSLVYGYNPELETYGSVNYNTLSGAGVSFPIASNVLPGYPVSRLTTNPFSQTELETRFSSYFANGGYTYNHRYTFNSSIRFDRSNLFGVDQSAQNKPVWSTGIKWLLSDEKFMQGFQWLSNLDFRATYGLSGNSPAPGSAASYNVFNASSSSFYPNNTGLILSTVANPKLTWESTKTTNLGLDFAVLKNRLNASIDLYQKNTSNLLGNMPVNPFSGYSVVTGNYGDMTNKGIELGINSVNVKIDKFSWSTILNFAYNKNEITKLNDPSAITTGDQLIQTPYVTGYSAFAIFAYKYAGLDDMGDPQIKLANGSITKAPNAAKPEDMVYMGTYQPVVNGGFTNVFTYNGFRLTANIIYNLGGVMRRDVQPFYYVSNQYSGPLNYGNFLGESDQSGFTAGQINPIFLQRWQKPGDEKFTNVPSYVANASVSYSRRNINYWNDADINVLSSSYIKMRDITLAYSLPKDILSKYKIRNLTFRLQVSNIMLWKANQYGIDPEFQDAFLGRRVPSVPSLSGMNINTTSYMYGQGTITFGVHSDF